MAIYNRIPKSLKQLNLDDFPAGQISTCWIHVINDGIGEAIRIPVVVAKGAHPGKVLGLTAAIHGDELNGISVLQNLFDGLIPANLHGTVVGVLALNVPGVLMGTRQFNNGEDLNDIAPGRINGNESDVYIYRVFDRVVNRFDYLIDLHTASRGRVNSYYIRADMSDQTTAAMARLQNADIILDNKPADGTLRGSAQKNGIYSITCELKDPGVFQKGVVNDSLAGIYNVLYYYRFLEGLVSCPVQPTPLCQKSYWIYTDEGGILSIKPKLVSKVRAGDTIGEVKTIFGEVRKTYKAPEDGIIIGRSINPINQTGSRIIHLGVGLSELPCIV